jgi:RHS repeat-associated protein
MPDTSRPSNVARRALRLGALAGAVLGACLSAAAQTSIGYQWTPLDALESVTTPEGVSSYAYDGDNLRAIKSSAGQTVVFVRDDVGRVIAEYAGDGSLIAEYVYSAAGRVAKIDAAGQRLYYHGDLVGTPLAITDAVGNLDWRGETLPFGAEFLSQGTGEAHTFTGQELDDETHLHYFGARYYDATVGRFISPDPAGGNLRAPHSLNRYAYSLNSPTRLTDPSGLFHEDFHYLATMVIAEAAGYPQPLAQMLAENTQAVDDRFFSSPFTGIVFGSLATSHFVTPEQLQALEAHASQVVPPSAATSAWTWGNEALAVGRYLHALQDSFSHTTDDGEPIPAFGGWFPLRLGSNTFVIPILGHMLLGTSPDDTARRPDVAVAAARATYEALTRLGPRAGVHPLVSFEAIEGGLREYFSLPEGDPRRDAVLAAVRDVIRPRP